VNDKIPVVEMQFEENNDPLKNEGKNNIRFLIHCRGLASNI
jgi:hypothetical protein